MPHAQQQRDLITALHLESLFDYGDLGAFTVGKDKGKAEPGTRRAESAAQGRLRDLIGEVCGKDCAAVASDVEPSAAACGRAAANIETWLAYLPRNCVRAMVRGGWHWNT